MLRFFFTKQGEAAYISLLDLQRVMARALKRSGIPVWYTQGFNPHIYMTFTLPLPLLQHSLAETMDCKTESELKDFSAYIPLLNKALPRGIVVEKIEEPKYKAAEIGSALYEVSYPACNEQLQKAVEKYNAAENALVVRKTKRSANEVDLKQVLPKLEYTTGQVVKVCLPAGSDQNYNPDLLVRFFEDNYKLPAECSYILRKEVYTADGDIFH